MNIRATVERLDGPLSLQVTVATIDSSRPAHPCPALASVRLQAPLDDVQHANRTAENQHPGTRGKKNEEVSIMWEKTMAGSMCPRWVFIS